MLQGRLILLEGFAVEGRGVFPTVTSYLDREELLIHFWAPVYKLQEGDCDYRPINKNASAEAEQGERRGISWAIYLVFVS